MDRFLSAKPKYFILFFLVVACLIIFLSWFPLKSQIEKQSLILKNESFKLQEINLKNSLAPSMEKEYASIKEDFAKIRGRFLSSQNLIDFVMTLEDFASQTGLEQKITVSPLRLQTDKIPYKSILFQVALKGTYPAVVQYLGLVENADFLISTPSIKIQSQAREPGLVEAGIGLQVFTSKDFKYD